MNEEKLCLQLMSERIVNKFAALGDIGQKWFLSFSSTEIDKRCSLLFKQGMFGLNWYINNNLNCNYNRGYFLILSKKGILMWQLNADYLLLDKDKDKVDIDNAYELLIFGSLPHGKMFGEFGNNITKDLIINYLTNCKINDKHKIVQNYFYFSHFRIINEMIFDNQLDDFNNVDAAYDSKRNLLFACVKLANFSLKILVYNNNNDNNNNNNNSDDINAPPSVVTHKTGIEPIDGDEEKLGGNTNGNDDNDHICGDKQNNNKDNKKGKEKKNNNNNNIGLKSAPVNNTNGESGNIDVSDVLDNQDGLSSDGVTADASDNLVIFECPLNSTVVNEDEDEEKDKDKDVATMDFVLNFDDKKRCDEFRAILCDSEQMILMFHSYQNDATYILTRQIVNVKNSRFDNEHEEYLRLIELNGEIIYQMLKIHGMYLKFEQLVNSGGIIVCQQKNIDTDLQWTDKYQHFTERLHGKSIYRYATDCFVEWIFNDNDNCIIGYGVDVFVMIPLSQLLLIE